LGSRSLKQVYIPYNKWECYKNGMYLRGDKNSLNTAVDFMNDIDSFSKSMSDVIYLWKFTMKNHLTNSSINKKAFLGQCAVFYKKQIPESITKKAWKLLSDSKKIEANNIAKLHIKNWEKWYKTRLLNTYQHGKKDVIKKGYQTKLHLE
jgi:hypothetical protein